MPSNVAFQIGPIVVHWYGIMIMLGVIAASYISLREAKRRGEDPDHVWGLFPWVLVAGILGARLGWALPNIGNIPTDPLPVFGMELPWPFRYIAIWLGGLSIQGAIIGGALAVALYCRRYKIRLFKWGDIIVPGLALAQAIGRWGNYFNQEAFGGKTDLPWGIPISVERQRAVAGPDFPADPTARFHPTFAYEMIWDLLNFALLMWLGRQKRLRLREGDLLWVYLIFYSIGRFAIEELRVDSAMVSGLKVPQLVAVLTIVLAWTMLIWRHRPGSTVPYSETNLPDSERRVLVTNARAATRDAVLAPQGSRIRRVPVGAERSGAADVQLPQSSAGGLQGPEGSQAGT